MDTELVKKEEILQLVLDHIPSFVFWKDTNCNYLGCNRNFAKSAGLASPVDIIGKNDYDMPWTKEDSDFFRKIDKEVMESGKPQINFEESQRIYNGDIKWLKTSKIPLYNEQQKVIGILGTYEDITLKKSLELELLSRNAKLENLNEKLEMVNTDLEQFAYATSHDLQEPLRMIIGFTGLLENKYAEVLDESGKEYLHFVKEGAKRMSSLIQQILSYSKLNQVEEEFEEANLKELISDLVNDLSPHFDEKNAKITLNLPKKKIKCHPERMNMLFNNLISNGVKFDTTGSPKVDINFEERETEWYFTVADNGIGIEENYQEYVFKPFKRLNTRDKFIGDGVGLSLCKRIINLHRGQIWFTKNEAQGTTFHFTIGKL